jgi:hypothetical protein
MLSDTPRDPKDDEGPLADQDVVLLAMRLMQRAKELLAGAAPAVDSQTSAADQGDTNFGKVRRYFESVNNRPSTTTQIRQGAGISRGALSNLLYSTHGRFFVAVPSPSHQRKKLWSLTALAVGGQAAVETAKDLAGLSAHECCRRILLEHNNQPMHALTLAKEAIRRGYFGRGQYTGDAMEWVTAKSFWARLSRTNKSDFEQVEHMVFRVRHPSKWMKTPDLFSQGSEEE